MVVFSRQLHPITNRPLTSPLILAHADRLITSPSPKFTSLQSQERVRGITTATAPVDILQAGLAVAMILGVSEGVTRALSAGPVPLTALGLHLVGEEGVVCERADEGVGVFGSREKVGDGAV